MTTTPAHQAAHATEDIYTRLLRETVPTGEAFHRPNPPLERPKALTTAQGARNRALLEEALSKKAQRKGAA
jgi:hypothetical protein